MESPKNISEILFLADRKTGRIKDFLFLAIERGKRYIEKER